MEILAVIVRYQVPLQDSATFAGITRALAADPSLRDALGFLIWDNSPQPLSDPLLPAGFEYHHSPANVGVSAAYNESARIAAQRRARWMLLLDQDTVLPQRYLQTMLETARILTARRDVAAIVPTVKVGNLIVSPRRSVFNGHRGYAGRSGIAEGEVFAINSGCLLRLSALQAIGGFSTEFWLDYSDRYIFHQFFLHGLHVWRANIQLQHQMTILDYDRLMSPWRYRNFIEAEGAFNDLYKGSLENAVQSLRLVVRALRQKVRYRNKPFAAITWQHLWRRFTTPRSRRIDLWKSAQRAR